MTYHKTGEKLNTGEQIADLTDFLEPDTAYAVVLQAANQDGPGPYSEQHTIRTMSRGMCFCAFRFRNFSSFFK